MLVVLDTGVDRHRNGLGAADEGHSVVGVEPQNFVCRGQGVRVVLLLYEAGDDVLQGLHFVKPDLLSLLWGVAEPLFLSQLSVVDSLRVPLRVLALEVSPNAVGLLKGVTISVRISE